MHVDSYKAGTEVNKKDKSIRNTTKKKNKIFKFGYFN